ncbi:MAG: hypothetical protein ACOYM2_20680 [Rectinemataceae bacterium]
MTIEVDIKSLEAILRMAGNTPDSTEIQWFSIENCAKAWGFEKNYFYKKKHLLPNYGIFDDPIHKRFSKESFMAWVKVPLYEWESRWASMSSDERRKIEKSLAA